MAFIHFCIFASRPGRRNWTILYLVFEIVHFFHVDLVVENFACRSGGRIFCMSIWWKAKVLEYKAVLYNALQCSNTMCRMRKAVLRCPICCHQAESKSRKRKGNVSLFENNIFDIFKIYLIFLNICWYLIYKWWILLKVLQELQNCPNWAKKSLVGWFWLVLVVLVVWWLCATLCNCF